MSMLCVHSSTMVTSTNSPTIRSSQNGPMCQDCQHGGEAVGCIVVAAAACRYEVRTREVEGVSVGLGVGAHEVFRVLRRTEGGRG